MKKSKLLWISLCLSLLTVSNTVKGDIVKSPACEQLVINLLQPAIEEKIKSYYGQEMSANVELYNYGMHIIEMKAELYKLPTVTLQVTTMIGAHNPIADYEIKFSVDNGGDVKVLKFKQLKVYPETLERFDLTLTHVE